MADHRREYGTRGDCYAWPRRCAHRDDLDCIDASWSTFRGGKALLRHRLSYWLRPYDAMLDARRWRWAKSGCEQSREAVEAFTLAMLGQPAESPPYTHTFTPSWCSEVADAFDRDPVAFLKGMRDSLPEADRG